MRLSERGMGTVPRSSGYSSHYQRGWTAQLIRTHSGEQQASDRDVLLWPATGHPKSAIHTTTVCLYLTLHLHLFSLQTHRWQTSGMPEGLPSVVCRGKICQKIVMSHATNCMHSLPMQKTLNYELFIIIVI